MAKEYFEDLNNSDLETSLKKVDEINQKIAKLNKNEFLAFRRLSLEESRNKGNSNYFKKQDVVLNKIDYEISEFLYQNKRIENIYRLKNNEKTSFEDELKNNSKIKDLII